MNVMLNICSIFANWILWRFYYSALFSWTLLWKTRKQRWLASLMITKYNNVIIVIWNYVFQKICNLYIDITISIFKNIFIMIKTYKTTYFEFSIFQTTNRNTTTHSHKRKIQIRKLLKRYIKEKKKKTY